MNQFIVSGTLESAPEITVSKKGQTICKFNLLHESGKRKRVIPFMVMGELGDRIGRLAVGAKLTLTGSLDGHEWEGKIYLNTWVQFAFCGDERPEDAPPPTSEEALPF